LVPNGVWCRVDAVVLRMIMPRPPDRILPEIVMPDWLAVNDDKSMAEVFWPVTQFWSMRAFTSP
jgi:hypothetical protein